MGAVDTEEPDNEEEDKEGEGGEQWMSWEESMATERTATREAILAEQDEAEWLAGERATEQETEELRRKTNRTEENKEHENGLRAVLNRATATACQKLEEAAETRRPDTITKWEKTGRKSITWRKRRKARYARSAVKYAG